MIRPASRLQRVPPYLFAELERQAGQAVQAGVDVINLGIGDPDLPTPPHVVRAAQEAVAKPRHHRYPPGRGTEGFRGAAAEFYRRRFGVQLDPAREVVGLIGSKEGLAHLTWAFVDPGDLALVPDPAYPVYKTQTLLAGGEAVDLPLLEERSFLPDLGAIPADVMRRAKVLFLNYPNNPTGAVATLDFLKSAVAFCAEHGLLLVHDLAYAEMTYDGFVAPSALQVEGARECCVEFYSLSKPFNMTGWRVAFCVGNEVALAALAALKSGLDSGQFGAIQEAAELALLSSPPEFLEQMREVYTRRRDLACGRLNAMGLCCRKPLGTFYLWVRVPAAFGSSSFASHLLARAGVVVSPGSAFGASGEGYVRLALTVGEDRLAEALDRMAGLI